MPSSAAGDAVQFDADVVVVGAGFAGLAAATELERHGLDVRVVEARDRVGGKTESQLDQLGRRVDTGGQFVCDDMTNVLELIDQLGLHLVAADHDRPGRAFAGGSGTTSDPVELWRTFDEVEELYGRLWHMPDPLPDTTTLGSWFESLAVAPEVVDTARSALGGAMCMSIDEIPLAHAVHLARRTPLTRDELQYVVVETIHSVAEAMAARLRSLVGTGTPVRAIDAGHGSAGVVVSLDGAPGHAPSQLRCRHVVVAVPPTAHRGITFTPALPMAVQQAAAAFRPGSVMKFLVRYPTAFWRSEQIGSTAVWLEPAGLYVGEASLDERTPTLVAFLGGPATETWRDVDARQRRTWLLERLVEAYGPAAAAPVSFVERDWCSDEWGGGGYWNVLVDASADDAVEVLRGGAPHITFASTELAPSFPGYIEGAITSGRWAAAAVVSALASA